jgi:hypothetical protein
MSQQSPQELFPNLFAANVPQKRAAEAMKPQDLRLLQYCMRQASKASPRPAPAPLPVRRPATAAARPATAAARPATAAARPAR